MNCACRDFLYMAKNAQTEVFGYAHEYVNQEAEGTVSARPSFPTWPGELAKGAKKAAGCIQQ